MASRDNVLRFVRTSVNSFFRRVRVRGEEYLPSEGGGIVVSWHPNGIVDPAVLLASFPRPIVFGARDGLFGVPGFGNLLRASGAVPIYRAMDHAGGDPEARKKQNARSLDALARAVAEGSFTALFPEGDSHDGSDLLELRTGAARLYYRARQLQRSESKPPAIVVVGLHYDRKHALRSSALVEIAQPMVLPPELDITPGEDEPVEVQKERARALTHLIEQHLRDTVRPSESWEMHETIDRARTLILAERALEVGYELPAGDDIDARVTGFEEVWRGYHLLKEHDPERARTLVARVRAYDADMDALELEDVDLDRSPTLFSPQVVALLFSQLFLLLVFLPPILLVAGIINVIPAGLIWLVARVASKRVKDMASIKLVLGAFFFPLIWGIAAYLGAVAHETAHEFDRTIPDNFWLSGLVLGAIGPLGGAALLRYRRLIRQTRRAFVVRITRARERATLAMLKQTRRELYEEFSALDT